MKKISLSIAISVAALIATIAMTFHINNKIDKRLQQIESRVNDLYGRARADYFFKKRVKDLEDNRCKVVVVEYNGELWDTVLLKYHQELLDVEKRMME